MDDVVGLPGAGEGVGVDGGGVHVLGVKVGWVGHTMVINNGDKMVG